MGYLRWAARLAAFAALLVVAIQNTDEVTFRLFREWAWQVPLILLLLLAFLGGAALAGLAVFWRSLRLRRELFSARRELRARRKGLRPPPAPRSAT
jgi:uncharacterized integral membrane protein